MQAHVRSTVGPLSLMSICVVVLLGCAKPPEPEKPTPFAQLEKVGQAYERAQQILQRPPKNLDEIKEFVKELGNPDDILRSPNDHEPYQIIWGVDVTAEQPDGSPKPIIAYEKNGQNGKRFILRAGNVAEEVPDADFIKVLQEGKQRPRR